MESLSISPSVNYSYVFEFEEKFPFKEAHEWIYNNYRLSIYASVVYLLFIYFGKKFMKHRPKYELRPALIVWNAALAFLSTVGALRTLPELLFMLREYGFTRSVCDGGYVLVSPVCSMWTWIFTVLKVVELGDTVFIILRKQELSFLQWFHHVTSLLSVWYSFTMAFGAGRWVIVMNYIVHSIMYTYYLLRASRVSIPRFAAMTITVIQMIQFTIGFCAACRVVQVLLQNEPCHSTLFNAFICISVYVSNFILFVNFFRQVYFKRSKEKRVKKQ